MAEYGSPMGVEQPGSKRPERPRAKEASVAERRAALKSLESRSAGESRRSNESGRGTSQGDKVGVSAVDAVRKIKDKKYADMKAIDEQSS